VLDDYEKKKLAIYVRIVFSRLFWIVYYLYTELGVYHRDLSEGNVLVRPQHGLPHPLLIDFDHARLRTDDRNDNMHSRTGTVPFMSILNLAGRSQNLSIVDELESFMYLWVWKCSIGFSPSHITRSNTASNTPQVSSPQPSAASISQDLCTRLHITSHKPTSSAQKSKLPVDDTEKPSVRAWAKGDPGRSCLKAKILHTSDDMSFSLVLEDLPPEFKNLKPLFLDLREALFDWDGQQASYFKRKSSKPTQELEFEPYPGEDAEAANQRFIESEMERADQEGDASTSDRLPSQEVYFERLSSRSHAENLDVILEKFVAAIDTKFHIPFK
ncbi:hypothetical protein IWQ61_010606, partial [Dispira simplex]